MFFRFIGGGFLAASAAASFAQQQYHVIDLGAFGGVGNSWAAASNLNGEATGDADITANVSQAMYYSSATGIVKIGNFANNPNAQSQGEWINAGGTVVGFGTATTGKHHAFNWHSGGSMQDMGLLPGGTASTAYAI